MSKSVATSRVHEVYPSEDGQIRKCKILMSDKSLDSQGRRQSKPVYLQRPVHKLLLLLAVEDQEEQKLKEWPGIPRRRAKKTIVFK